MNKEHFRIAVYDTNATPDALIALIGYNNPTATAAGVASGGCLLLVNEHITSENQAVNIALSFSRRFQSQAVKGHTRYEIYGQHFDDTSNGTPAAPANPQYVLTAADNAEQLYISGDTMDVGRRQRLNASNKPSVASGAAFDSDVNEDVPSDNG